MENGNDTGIKNGSFIAVHRKWVWWQPVSYLSVLIRIFTRSYWNHTAVGIIVNGQDWVMESNHKGVVIEPFEVWENKYGRKVYEIHPPLNKIDFKDLAVYVGKPYDFMSLFVWQPIYILTGIWLGRKGVKGAKRTYCTEIWSYAMGLPDAYKLTTADIMKRYYGG